MPNPTHDRRATRLHRQGVERARYLARRLGTGLREWRHAQGLTQAQLGDRVGVSQREISRLECGAAADANVEMWAVCGAALGLQLAAFFEGAPGADQPRDLQHLRRQNLVIASAAPGGWRGEPESALPDDGPRPRSIDVLLTRAARREAAVVEVWDLILDGGAAMRGLEAKVLATRARLGPEWRAEGVLLVRGTQRNRRLVASLGALFAARYPASSRAWLRAFADPAAPMPQAGGFAWTDVNGGHLRAARLRTAP